MPSLSGFAAFARKVGAVPLVPPFPSDWGTGRATTKAQSEQLLSVPVPPVPHVPLENDKGWDEADWQAAFDERAGILEYDEGLPRAEAERLAREQVFGARTAAA